jgi:threonine synthase
MTGAVKSYLSHLECPECGKIFNADQLQTYCLDCRSPLYARYDLPAVRSSLKRTTFSRRPRGLWRWAELLPVRSPANRLTLGEGDTPLLFVPHLGAQNGLSNLWVKNEADNPTGSFKARGLGVAVARAMELGVKALVIPTAGNAGGALAAYASRAHLEAHVFMPPDAPRINQVEVVLAGADLQLVQGLINDSALAASSAAAAHGWFDVSTFKEPYRLEGKKTMGFELAESFGWQLPDVIVYPTGGGTGLVGMWKAFDELESLGWIDSKRPRMVSVQAEGCAPLVRAFQNGGLRAEPWENAHTLAAGLRVPVLFADRIMLALLRESRGIALAVNDDEILAAQSELAKQEGILAAPEGAATLAGLKHLVAQGWLQAHEKIVLFNTGSGLKYV